MYHLIGDYVRLGDTTKDPLHSTVVKAEKDCVLSINRTNRKLNLHVWIRREHAIPNTPDILMPALSTEFDALKKTFLFDEKASPKKI